MTKHFFNLTNGIEAIEEIEEIDNKNINFIRIQSTTLEKHNWYKFFIDIDHNLLMWLALGAKCKVYDFGANRPKSKVIYMGVPILEYCLNKYWFGYEADKVIIGRKPGNHKLYIDKEIYNKYFMYHSESVLDAKIQITSKYKYYRKFIHNINKVNIEGISNSTTHDSDVSYYNQILNNLRSNSVCV